MSGLAALLSFYNHFSVIVVGRINFIWLYQSVARDDLRVRQLGFYKPPLRYLLMDPPEQGDEREGDSKTGCNIAERQ